VRVANQAISPVLNRFSSEPAWNESFTWRSYIMTQGLKKENRIADVFTPA
jgi:hypothetical protein